MVQDRSQYRDWCILYFFHSLLDNKINDNAEFLRPSLLLESTHIMTRIYCGVANLQFFSYIFGYAWSKKISRTEFHNMLLVRFWIDMEAAYKTTFQ